MDSARQSPGVGVMTDGVGVITDGRYNTESLHILCTKTFLLHLSTHMHTHTHTHTQTHTHTLTHTNYMQTHTLIFSDALSAMFVDGFTNVPMPPTMKTYTHTHTHTERDTHRPTDTHTHTHRHTHTHTHKTPLLTEKNKEIDLQTIHI